MPHQEQGPLAGGSGIAAALDWLVTPKLFSPGSFREDCRWTPAALVQAAAPHPSLRRAMREPDRALARPLAAALVGSYPRA